ncbi:MAG TPA: glutamine--fructose-6-phosphate transaminase (isomerizing) [Bacillota bacterium]|nr:glutamine--fructose-6-phosphate transaminase (isomerizing) [Bacillota bacterium]
MCGIVGYIGDESALPFLVKGLKKLEYRGYDSAGVTFLENGSIGLVKKKGKVAVLEQTLQEAGLLGSEREKTIHIGMGHTRWATHGAPSDENSHPHISENHHICVVHNGIIENYMVLKKMLLEQGFKFISETDTEVIAHLIEYHYLVHCHLDLLSAVQMSLQEIEGSYAIVVMCTEFPDCLIAAKKENPLIIGIGENANYVASDIPAVLEYTRDIVIVEDDEIAVVKKDSYEVVDMFAHKVKREITHVDWDTEAAEKGGYEHFMMKEMLEEPKVVNATIAPRIRDGKILLEQFNLTKERILRAKNIHIVACGTAYHAGCIGKYLIERFCRIPVFVDVASEFLYRNPILDQDSIVIIVSQSGETIDTLQALKLSRSMGAYSMAIVNVIGSSIAREADYVLYTAAGPEISVASTKAYSTQIAAIYLLTFEMAHRIGSLSDEDYVKYQQTLLEIPKKLEETIAQQDQIQRFAALHYNADSIFFLGRGLDYYLSMEASLKLKEISYIHSEAYASGELKHGTIALIEPGTLVVCAVTQKDLAAKELSNIQEVKTRGACVLAISTKDMKDKMVSCDEVFYIPDGDPLFAPLLAATPCQLFAYYMAVNKGCDVDKPRNLAKSVTVE